MFCIPALESANWLQTPNLEIKDVDQQSRWLLKQTFTNATKASLLEQHPWFEIIESTALPLDTSDLAWRIPQYYWESGVAKIDNNATKKFKFMANKTAKCVALAIFYAKYGKHRRNDPKIAEIMEFAAILSAERPFDQLKIMANTEADNLGASTAEFFRNPMDRWSALSEMALEKNVLCTNYTKPEETLVIWAHAIPEQGETTIHFSIAEVDKNRIEPKAVENAENAKNRATLKRKLAELNMREGIKWQMTVRKAKLLANCQWQCA